VRSIPKVGSRFTFSMKLNDSFQDIQTSKLTKPLVQTNE
jgi:hypothetical protein